MRARDNPFATVHVHRIRYRFDGLTWDQFMERLAQWNYRGAIVGPEGTGKSTLLEDLRPRLAERGFEPLALRLTQETPRPTNGRWTPR
jgi:ABC-type hemin transport system ATPase subunit